jgi:two-component system capsular synthesis sensor histidine kinase RcsC
VREALAAIAEGEYDVVLTDGGLPDGSGEEVARAVVARETGTPVVMLTGWADWFDPEKARREGVCRVLGKPVTLAALARALDEVTRPRGGYGEGEASGAA